MRKQFFLLLCLLLTVPAVSHAQWRAGVSGGGDYNWFTLDKQYQTDFRYDGAWGWNAAVFGQYDFLPWVGLRAEIEASERNYRFRRTGIYSGTNYTVHNTYLQVPLMARFSFGGQQVRGFVNAGVYAGYWLTGRYKGSQFNIVMAETYPVDEAYIFQKEKDQRWDFGLAGGIGIEYRFLAHWAVHIEGRCYYSFVSTVKPYMLIKDNRFNTTIGINAGFTYIF